MKKLFALITLSSLLLAQSAHAQFPSIADYFRPAPAKPSVFAPQLLFASALSLIGYKAYHASQPITQEAEHSELSLTSTLKAATQSAFQSIPSISAAYIAGQTLQSSLIPWNSVRNLFSYAPLTFFICTTQPTTPDLVKFLAYGGLMGSAAFLLAHLAQPSQAQTTIQT